MLCRHALSSACVGYLLFLFLHARVLSWCNVSFLGFSGFFVCVGVCVCVHICLWWIINCWCIVCFVCFPASQRMRRIHQTKTMSQGRRRTKSTNRHLINTHVPCRVDIIALWESCTLGFWYTLFHSEPHDVYSPPSVMLIRDVTWPPIFLYATCIPCDSIISARLLSMRGCV